MLCLNFQHENCATILIYLSTDDEYSQFSDINWSLYYENNPFKMHLKIIIFTLLSYHIIQMNHLYDEHQCMIQHGTVQLIPYSTH